MADFHQNGVVATLHNLRERSLHRVERELTSFSATRPITLILPSLFSELEAEALDNIVNHLTEVPYISNIVIGLDQADEEQYRYALKYFGRLPQNHAVLWNDGPRMQAVHNRLGDAALAPQEPGKGRNVWYCIGYVLGARNSSVVALHDCDIVTYSREMLARLVYPVTNPAFPYVFSKGYYPRIADGSLNGRVTRLLVTPLLLSLEKTIGHQPYLDYLKAFRYPLAGEFAMRTHILPDIRIPWDWGLEIGVLSELWRNYSNNAICQVDISDAYDHKHQPLSQEDARQGLSRMSTDICKTVFRKLATDGVTFSQETLRTALAMGADRAILIVAAADVHQDIEPLAVAKILKAVIDEEQPNLVLAGKQAIDNDMNATGQMLSALLGWSQATFASEVKVEGGSAVVTREVDSGLQTVKVKLPAIVTVDLRLNQPRYASLPNIMKAKKKPLDEKTAADYGVDVSPRLEVVKTAEPETRQAGEIVPDVDTLVAKLKERGLA